MNKIQEACCPNCKKKLGEIDKQDHSVTFEKGSKVILPTYSCGLINYQFECPSCNKNHSIVMAM